MWAGGLSKQNVNAKKCFPPPIIVTSYESSKLPLKVEGPSTITVESA